MEQMVDGAGDDLVECVPNFSEGGRNDVMQAIQAAVENVPGVMLLDRHADAVHNRMVLTFAGALGPVSEAAFRGAARAAELIDMTAHRGVHPRLGATDVLPIIPLGETPMDVCVDVARRVARRIGAELGIPVYLYGQAASRPDRIRLPDLRRGEFESLREAIGRDANLTPDFGPSRVGSAGATIVGARPALIAYNVNLHSSDVSIARAVARAIRESSGGLPGVQAKGFATARTDVVQVSVNLSDSELTPLWRVFEAIRVEAERRHVEILDSELVGLIATRDLVQTANHYLKLPPSQTSFALEDLILRSMLPRRGGWARSDDSDWAAE